MHYFLHSWSLPYSKLYSTTLFFLLNNLILRDN